MAFFPLMRLRERSGALDGTFSIIDGFWLRRLSDRHASGAAQIPFGMGTHVRNGTWGLTFRFSG
jgi:hypothetical protein